MKRDKERERERETFHSTTILDFSVHCFFFLSRAIWTITPWKKQSVKIITSKAKGFNANKINTAVCWISLVLSSLQYHSVRRVTPDSKLSLHFTLLIESPPIILCISLFWSIWIYLWQWSRKKNKHRIQENFEDAKIFLSNLMRRFWIKILLEAHWWKY